MITVVTGTEIEKMKGDFESVINGMNMVGEISYSQYSKLYDEGTKQIQKAYELGKAELEKENAGLKEQVNILDNCEALGNVITEAYKGQLTKAKKILKKVIKFTWGEGWNYSLGVKVEAEDFLKEIE